MKNDVYILAVESSCDETSIAIVKNGCEVIAMSTNTQISTHENYGGVVPEIASRMHTENITRVLEDMLSKTSMNIEDMDAIAVTYAPGLLGSLLVGIEFAKTLSYVYNLPLIKVNHLIGHIYANNLEKKLTYPLLALIVSGGHTELVKMTGDYEFELLGETLDDAIGEAYDKVARVLGLKYPGGPRVEELALKGKPTYKMSKVINDSSYNFSYSGLKSSVININHNEIMKGNVVNKEDLAKSFQDAAIEELYRKCELAIKNTGINRILIAGGVSANKYLRSELTRLVDLYNGELLYPRMDYCTDNAAMIAAAAYPLYLKKEFSDYSLNGYSNMDIV